MLGSGKILDNSPYQTQMDLEGLKQHHGNLLIMMDGLHAVLTN